MSVVLVTGCSSGIGLATALHFGVRDPATATELSAALAAGSLPVRPLTLDVDDAGLGDARGGRGPAPRGPDRRAREQRRHRARRFADPDSPHAVHVRRLLLAYRMLMTAASQLEDVARAIHEAVTTETPRLRYVVGETRSVWSRVG